MRILCTIAMGIAALVVGCQPAARAHRSGKEPLQTSHLHFDLQRQHPAAPWLIELETAIPFAYHNPLPDTVYGVHCNGQLDITLERQTSDGWEYFWSPVLEACLSSPIIIPPSTIYHDTLRLFGVLPGDHKANPAFRSGDIEGTYRLVWNNLVLHYRDSGQGFGDSIAQAHRVSNPFTLARAR